MVIDMDWIFFFFFLKSNHSLNLCSNGEKCNLLSEEFGFGDGYISLLIRCDMSFLRCLKIANL